MGTRYFYLPHFETHGIQVVDDGMPRSSETMFDILYKHTPENVLKEHTSLTDAFVPPKISKARDLVAKLIETHTGVDLEELHDIYNTARKGERWIQNLRRHKGEAKSRFRQAWADAVRTDPNFWCDLCIVAIWSLCTKTIIIFVDNELKLLYHVSQTEKPDRPEDDTSTDWRCLYLMLENAESSSIYPCNITDNVNPSLANVVLPGALFEHKGNEDEWVALLGRLDRDRWVTHDQESVIKHMHRASDLSVNQKKSAAPAQRKATVMARSPAEALELASAPTCDTTGDTVLNPITKRKVKIGSKTYLALVKAGTIQPAV